MKIDGIPCPECGTLYFGLPTCNKCGWRDEAFYKWSDEQLERTRELERKELQGVCHAQIEGEK